MAHHCPWTQTLPFVVRSVPAFESRRQDILSPTLHFQLGPSRIKPALADMASVFGVPRRTSDRAVDAAYAVQREFQKRLTDAGAEALRTLSPKYMGSAGINDGDTRTVTA